MTTEELDRLHAIRASLMGQLAMVEDLIRLGAGVSERKAAECPPHPVEQRKPMAGASFGLETYLCGKCGQTYSD